MADKRMTLDEIVGQIKDGDTIAIGGWGPARRPMTMVRAIAKSKLKNLTLLSAGAFDIDMLLGAGKVKKIIVPFMSLEGAPSALGNYMRMRKEGNAFEMGEVSEHMYFSGFRAAAERLPFYPTRSGAFTDLMKINPHIKTIEAPYTGETLVAMPPFKVDVALIHVNNANKDGYGRIRGDEVIDPLISRATIANGGKVFISCERLVTMDELKCNPYNIEIIQNYVTGVVEAPYGAHPGKIYPDYGWDEKHLAEYGKASNDPEAFKAYLDKYIKVPNQEAYLKLVGKDVA